MTAPDRNQLENIWYEKSSWFGTISARWLVCVNAIIDSTATCEVTLVDPNHQLLFRSLSCSLRHPESSVQLLTSVRFMNLYVLAQQVFLEAYGRDCALSIFPKSYIQISYVINAFRVNITWCKVRKYSQYYKSKTHLWCVSEEHHELFVRGNANLVFMRNFNQPAGPMLFGNVVSRHVVQHCLMVPCAMMRRSGLSSAICRTTPPTPA